MHRYLRPDDDQTILLVNVAYLIKSKKDLKEKRLCVLGVGILSERERQREGDRYM
jgi:hypothetical protein